MPDKEHSDFGGSVAEKWLNCPGYYNAVKDLPPSPDSIHSVGGTAQHALIEHVVTTGDSPESFIGKPWMGRIPKEYTGNTYDDENAERAQVWMDAIYEHMDPMQFVLRAEQKVVVSSISKDMFGSCDLFAVDVPSRHLVIADYKDGFGIVDVNTTPQPRFYGVAVDDTMELQIDSRWRVDYIIVQPKAPKPVTKVTTTGANILEWRGVFRQGYLKSLAPDAPRVSGDHCQYCRAAGDCPARAEARRLSIRKEFAGPTPATRLTPEQIGNILRVAPEVKAWISDVEAHALSQALAGTPPPGFKIAEGRAGNRKWADGAAVEDILVNKLGVDKAYERKLLTPAKAEKLMGKVAFAEMGAFTVQDAGRPVLVPEGSERDNYTKQAQARAEFST